MIATTPQKSVAERIQELGSASTQAANGFSTKINVSMGSATANANNWEDNGEFIFFIFFFFWPILLTWLLYIILLLYKVVSIRLSSMLNVYFNLVVFNYKFFFLN